jgi:hypothetical protein
MPAFQLLRSQAACLKYHDGIALTNEIPIDAKERIYKAGLARYASAVLVERARADNSKPTHVNAEILSP